MYDNNLYLYNVIKCMLIINNYTITTTTILATTSITKGYLYIYIYIYIKKTYIYIIINFN